jgi:hypothetical protein
VAVSGAVANGDGTQVTATVSVAAAAALGPRAIVLDTPVESVGETPTPANTVQIVGTPASMISPLFAPLVGVVRGHAGGASQAIELASALLGVHVAQTPPTVVRGVDLRAALTGVVIGPAATAASPRYLPAGQSAVLRVEGVGLDAVTALQLVPDAGIALDAALEHVAEGGALTVPVSVAADAAQIPRRLVLLDGAGAEIPFALPHAAVVQVVGNEPRIDSIDPIQVTPGRTITLTIRGGNLFGVSAVTASPSTGLTFSVSPSGNADGTEVQVALTVAADAPGGPRVIRVVASTGTTTDESLPANTLTVVTGQ